MRYLPYLACVMAAVVVAGCASTDRTLQTAGSEVRLDTPRQIQPPEAVFSCFSPDGRYYAIYVPEGDRILLEVRSSDGDKTLYRQGLDHPGEALPVLFLKGGDELACLVEQDGVVDVLDWRRRTWRQLSAPQGTTLGDMGFPLSLVPLMNDRATMTYLGSCVLTTDGVVTPVRDSRATSGWDPNGRFLYQEAGAWTMVDEKGRESRVQAPLKIDPYPILARGTLRLSENSSNRKRNGSDVFSTEVWLDPLHGAASVGKDGPDSALVFLGYDVKSFGFVPGRDAVFVNSGGGPFLITFRSVKTETSGGSSVQRPD